VSDSLREIQRMIREVEYHHATECTLLAVYDHIIKSTSEKKVAALCLLDLSAAFETIDHSILLHRLSSWFGFDDTVISWLTSYL